NDYVELGTVEATDPLALADSNFTISAWIKPKLTGDSYQRIVDKSNGSKGANGYAFWINKDRKMSIQIDGNRFGSNNKVIVAGTWQHTAVTGDGSSYQLYVNGVPVTGSFVSGSYNSPSASTANMRIGTWNHSTGREFKGSMDEVAVFNRALSAEEIVELYENSLDSDYDYHLLVDSPCIDAGDPNYAAEANETDLDGKLRVVGSRIDMGAYEFEYIKASMKLTPRVLNQRSQGDWIKAHVVLPEGYDVNDVDVNFPPRVRIIGIESEDVNVFTNEDGLAELEISFERSSFCCSAIDTEVVDIDVVGLLTNGEYFFSSGTIRVIDNTLENLALLSSRWLDACDEPDWCSDLDINQDSIVNFLDFASIKNCSVEVIQE
ncbi:MAG: LamG-like jellyroll fold domain-containing protein, partial [Planctomycetota bacterium]